MPHPHGPTCRCPQPGPDDGLLTYTVTCDHYEQLQQALAQVATLRVTTFPPTAPRNLVAVPDDACDGTLTCRCSACEQERARRVREGVRRIPQPWDAAQRRRAA